MPIFYHYMLMLPCTVMLFWLVIFFVTDKRKETSCRIFMAFIIALFLCDAITAFSLASIKENGLVTQLYVHFIDCFVVPAAIPLFYIHMKSLTVSSRSHVGELALFIPSLILGFSNLIIGLMMGEKEFVLHRLNSPHNCTLEHFDFPIADWCDFFNITLYNWTVGILLVVLGAFMIVHLSQYRSRLENFYANVGNKSYKNIRNYLWWGLVLVLLCGLLVLLRRSFFSTHPFWAVVYCIALAIAGGYLCNNVYHIQFTAKDMEKEMTKDSATDKDVKQQKQDSTVKSEETLVHEDYSLVKKKLDEWATRSDKPYLSDGLTIVVVANETGLKQHVISNYLNGEMHMNFNTWVNGYRIEEVKRLLLDPENFTMLNIALQCGFTDAAALARIFKKFVGVTPSAYRSNH